MERDATLNIEFLRSDEGGRVGPTPERFFNCIFTVDDNNFDCRLLLVDRGPIKPGEKTVVPVKFLSIDLVKGHLSEGKSFSLREDKIIATGTIKSVP